jgi:Peptidase inhibitor I9
MRVGSRVLVVVLVVAALGALVPLAASSVAASRQTASQRVIVVLRNQDRGQPATRTMLARRRRALQTIQAPVLTQLSRTHARNVHSYTALNAVSATVTPAETAALKADPAVKEVVPDAFVHLAPPAASGSGAGSGSAGGTAPVPGACAPAGKPLLEPEALQTMNVDSTDPRARTARSLGLTGAGVKVGFIVDGLDTNNPDFIRADGQHVFVDYKDFSGFGTSAPTSGAGL